MHVTRRSTRSASMKIGIYQFKFTSNWNFEASSRLYSLVRRFNVPESAVVAYLQHCVYCQNNKTRKPRGNYSHSFLVCSCYFLRIFRITRTGKGDLPSPALATDWDCMRKKQIKMGSPPIFCVWEFWCQCLGFSHYSMLFSWMPMFSTLHNKDGEVHNEEKIFGGYI